MTQGLTTLIPKTPFWHLICPLNNNYKMFVLIFAHRLKMVLDLITEEAQSGYMSRRHITNNIRLVMDILNY